MPILHMNTRVSKVAVALSGGVDSAFAAASLQSQGWEVQGVHFVLPAPGRIVEDRIRAVRAVSSHLKIPLALEDLTEAFNTRVVTPFVDGYLRGLTPNPCVVCNARVKFEHLLQYADERSIECIATGHYVRLYRDEVRGLWALRRGTEGRKEQSYFLHRLSQEQLRRAVFPLGTLTKAQVRERASDLCLPVHGAKESQEICFLSGRDYRSYIEGREGVLIPKGGEIVTTRGQVVGVHGGTHRYTIGQRHGLGIASDRPYYVKEIRAEENIVVVGRKEELLDTVVEAESFHWIDGEPYPKREGLFAQVRYRHVPASGRITACRAETLRFQFDAPQYAITPGQCLALYDGDRLLGGGWIVRNRDCGMRDAMAHS
jgi:tRNA-specific 2-thiouridylase